jgi:uncharacterized protein (DUF4213/DUF364 family)
MELFLYINFEPLKHFYNKYNYDVTLVRKIVVGERYTAVVMRNGNIGVCANQDRTLEKKIITPKSIDLKNEQHRIIYNAYLNALLNYKNEYESEFDIFSAVDFTQYKNSVMIGYFIPIVKKFDSAKIKLSVFDMLLEDERLTSHEKKNDYVTKADCRIVTATTIMNSTLGDLLSQTNDNCDVYLLGPSSIMHEDMLLNTNIKSIFGAIFKKNDDDVLKLIKEGRGTRDFIKLGRKVVFGNLQQA